MGTWGFTHHTHAPRILICVCVFVRVCVRAHKYMLSHAQLCVTEWTVACQAPPPMEFSRPEYWSGLPCPPAGDLPDPSWWNLQPLCLLHWQAGSLPLNLLGSRIPMCVFKWSPGFLGYSDSKKTKQTKAELCLSPLSYLINECLAFYNSFLKWECDTLLVTFSL